MADVEVTFRAKNSQLRSGLDAARADVRKFAQQARNEVAGTGGVMDKLGAGIRSAFAPLTALLTTGTLLHLGRQAATFASDVNDAAEALGITARQLQTIQIAADEGGVGAVKLEGALRNINQNSAEAAGGSEAMQKNFARLGIDVAKFVALRPDQRIEAMAKAFDLLRDDPGAVLAFEKIVGEKVGPRLAATFQRIAREGFEGLGRQFADAIASDADIQKLDAFVDRQATGWRRVLALLVDIGAAMVSIGASTPEEGRDRRARRQAVLMGVGRQLDPSLSSEARKKILGDTFRRADDIANQIEQEGEFSTKVRGRPVRIGLDEFSREVQAQREAEANTQGDATARRTREAEKARADIEAKEKAGAVERVNAAIRERDARLRRERMKPAAELLDLELELVELQRREANLSLPEKERLAVVKDIEEVQKSILRVQQEQTKEAAKFGDGFEFPKGVGPLGAFFAAGDKKELAAAAREEKERDRRTLAETDSQTRIGGAFRGVSRFFGFGRGGSRGVIPIGGDPRAIGFGLNPEGGPLGFRPEFGGLGVEGQKPFSSGVAKPVNTEAQKQTTLQKQMVEHLRTIAGAAGGGTLPGPGGRFGK